MSTADQTVERVEPRVAERSRLPRPSLRGDWWRHLVALIAVGFALFPIAYVASAAFNADSSLGGASLIPRSVTLDNFRELLAPDPAKSQLQSSTSHYARWLGNSLVIALARRARSTSCSARSPPTRSAASASAAGAWGCSFLLLIQMFPQLLALVAIYLILLRTGDVFPFIGLDTKTGLMLVYLGGVMGINTWLLKGFFDTIPAELDESARVDGATPAQIFWGVVLPLALPILAVIAILSFVGTSTSSCSRARCCSRTRTSRCRSACAATSTSSTPSTGARSRRACCSRASRSWSSSCRCSGSSSAA